MDSELWNVIHEQRRALATDLADLAPEQWQTPSLCEGWTVLDVLAHIVSTARMTPPKFLVGFAAARFDFPKFSERGIAVESAGGPQATLQRLRDVATFTSAPPGPKESWLGETLVHCEDIRRPLGIRHAYPLESVTRMIRFYSRSNVLISGKKRSSGLTLRATDTDWSYGDGPAIEGPAMSLLMAVTGRKQVLADLSGPGLPLLAGR